ncbi:MAG: HXXEE domain-containing protein [Promethearchaeota archaeon]
MSISKIKTTLDKVPFKKAVWLAPILYLFHMIEEAVFRFYDFVAIHRGLSVNFGLPGFLIANMFIMLVYIVLLILFTLRPNRANAFFVLTLFTAAQFFNAFFHLYWTIVFMEYCPGVVTGFALYVPYVSILLWIAYKDEFITKTTAILIVLLGFTLMFLFELPGLQIATLVISVIIVVATNIIYYFKSKSKK